VKRVWWCMARPKKTADERREDRLNARFTMAERAAIEQAADALGITPSEYVRRCSLGYRLPANQSSTRATAELTAALLRLGVNLNQVAKHMNAGRQPPGYLEHLITDIARHVERLSDEPSGDRKGPQL
jgi:hypothetical protein